MSISGPSNKEQQEWQTENDVRTIQLFGEIIADAPRHERAKKRFEEKIVEMEKSKQAMEKMKSAGMDYSKSPKPEIKK